MTNPNSLQPGIAAQDPWLKRYYLVRAAFSAAWVALAFTVGTHSPAFAALLFVVYPAWDAVANLVDARRHGGLGKNPSQALNAGISALTTAAIAIALGMGLNAVLGVFGAWAALSGVLQLATGVRRWRLAGAQWAMVLSGAQSLLAGTFFIKQALAAQAAGIATVAPYAAFGAFYFLVSGIWLAVAEARRATRTAATAGPSA